MLGSLKGLPPLARYLTETSVWSEGLEWNSSFAHKVKDDFFKAAQPYAGVGVNWFPSLHFWWTGNTASKPILPLHFSKAPVSPKCIQTILLIKQNMRWKSVWSQCCTLHLQDPFNQFWGAYYVPGAVLGTRDTKQKQKRCHPCKV